MTGRITDVRVEPFSPSKNVIHPREPYSLFHADRIMKNYELLRETFVMTIYEDISKIEYPERASPLKITDQWYAAVDCLEASLYAGSIIFATSAIEAAMSYDLRMEALRTNNANKDWISLNLPNLRAAAKIGLPINNLLNESESLDSGKIIFIERRNKAAHGDYLGYNNIKDTVKQRVFMHKDDSGKDVFIEIPAREPIDLQAVDQINKSRNFLVEWAKQRPNLRI